ncbi:uncharacterized protein K444DRAFT_545605, partial [Hyaloscypha bicolor E]
KITFRTYYSYFKYLIISFKLTNILLLNCFIIIYLNNILIYSRNKNKYYNYIY